MRKFTLFITIVSINILFAILLINKQNKIISLLYTIQQLQEQRDQLLERKKELCLELHKEQQLSDIQTFATQQLHMKPIHIKHVKTISLPAQKNG